MNVSFLDLSNASYLLSAPKLGSVARSLSFVGGYTIVDPDHAAMVVADLNGDGFLDFASVESAGVSVMLGQASRVFTPLPAIAVGGSPKSIATGDFNGDGIPDLVTADSEGYNATVLLGKGDGTFSLSTYKVGYSASAIVVADFNRDGVADSPLQTRSLAV